MLSALLCMLSSCISNNGIFAYLSEVNPTKLPVSLYWFPPAQFKLEFLFDPGSGTLTTFLGSARCYSFKVVDDFKKTIKIFVYHFDSMISDRCILNQFSCDFDANQFIVTFGGRLQAHQLQPATSVFTCLLVMNTFQPFRSLSYIHPLLNLLNL